MEKWPASTGVAGREGKGRMNEEGTGRGRRSWGDERTGGEGAGVREGDESG